MSRLLIQAFIHDERPKIQDYHKAIERFKTDLPTVINTLRETLDSQAKSNRPFKAAFKSLFTLCQESINPKINAFDIREMIIQHILTEDIFLTVFNDNQFHCENSIAQQLEAVVKTFFIGKIRRETLKSLEPYYAVIRREAANIANHPEKQTFLKVVYEHFYQAYNPKTADRLGLVYTPSEIVRFMIESTDYLLEKHFNRLLADENVEILDPATGTGTFITELIEYLPKNRLRYKYLNEMHCNELAILPYYIAKRNIEYTYKKKWGNMNPFLIFVLWIPWIIWALNIAIKMNKKHCLFVWGKKTWHVSKHKINARFPSSSAIRPIMPINKTRTTITKIANIQK